LSKIIISADSVCDLGPELKQRCNVNYYPFHVILEDKQYGDGVDITPDEIFDVYRKKKVLPKTAAINATEYVDYFRQWTDEGYEVIHITLGSGFSAVYTNCCLAAKELPGIYPINSKCLSTGTGHLVIEAAVRAAYGMSAAQIQAEVSDLASKVRASFVIDNLEFLHKGGRCSALAALGANLLGLKPCIEVDCNTGGQMNVGKKYRGSLEKALAQYTADKLAQYENIRTDKIFITHSGVPDELIDIVRDKINAAMKFDNIYVTRAGCTISAHCGPGTLGILFMTE